MGNWLKIEVLVAVCLIPLFIVPVFAENYIDFPIVEKRGNELYLEYEGHLDSDGGIFNIFDYRGVHIFDNQFSTDDDGNFSGVVWSEEDAYRSWDDGIYRVELLVHDTINEHMHFFDSETTFKLEEKPSGNFQHTIQILDGSMEKKCGNSCVEPPVLYIQRGDRIKFVHNDCTGCHHMAIFGHPDQPNEPWFPEYDKTRFWDLRTWTHQDVLHPWITGKFVVGSEIQDVQPETEPQPTPTSTPEPEELGFASFVDPEKDPQHYVDRYNNEPEYKKWFDENFPEYSSIFEAIGLEEPREKIPDWVRNIFIWYGEKKISEDDLIGAIQFLVKEGIIKI